MVATPHFLAVDIDISGLTLSLVGKDGELVDSVRRSVQKAEDGSQEPQDWWRGVRTGTKDLLRRSKVRKDDVRAIGITGSSHGVVCLNHDGEVLAPSFLEPVPQQAEFLEELESKVGARNLVNLTGSQAQPGCQAADLLWTREVHKRVWHDLNAALAPRDFLRYRFTDSLMSDPSVAVGSRLFSPRNRVWSKQAIERLDFDPSWFPNINAGQLISGRVTATAAKETGLVAGTPVVTGGSRPATLAVASGVLEPGQMMIELGGSGAVILVTERCLRQKVPGISTGCHCMADRWTLQASGLAAGSGLRWYTEELAAAEAQQWRRAGRDTLEVVAELASEAPPGADGLHWFGPGINSSGGLTGLRTSHTRMHVLRAILESVGYNLRQCFAGMEATGGKIEKIIISGPGASNNLWCQIIADALNMPVTSRPKTHGLAMGAGMLAAVSIGSLKGVPEAVKKLVAKGTTYKPRVAAVEAYAASADEHQRLALSLAGEDIEDEE